METTRPLLKNLGAKLCQMMAEDWRGEDERNTLGMAGYWLEKLGEDKGPAKIITEHVLPPIPTRSHDWHAWYDGREEDGPHGWGETEEKAQTDLINNYDAP